MVQIGELQAPQGIDFIQQEDFPEVYFVEVEGLKATQSFRVIPLLERLAQEDFKIAIEIGTQEGGFALLLKRYLNCEVHTVDLNDWEPRLQKRQLFWKYGINFILEDCFESPRLEGIMKDRRKKIVFCDGGHKGNEFTYFARMINPGDWIGGHDFFDTKKDRSDKIWTTCELWLDQLDGAIVDLRMKRRLKELADPAVWCLFER